MLFTLLAQKKKAFYAINFKKGEHGCHSGLKLEKEVNVMLFSFYMGEVKTMELDKCKLTVLGKGFFFNVKKSILQ